MTRSRITRGRRIGGRTEDGVDLEGLEPRSLLSGVAPVGAADAFTMHEDGLLTIAVAQLVDNDTDGEMDPLTAAEIAQPGNGTLVLVEGALTYRPDENYAGVDTFTYRPSDGTGLGEATTVTIYVNPVIDMPDGRDDAYRTPAGQTLEVPASAGVLANDVDPEGQPLVVRVAMAPRHGTLTLNEDGGFTYTPDAGFVGTDAFTYCVRRDLEQPQAAALDGENGTAVDWEWWSRSDDGRVTITVDPPVGAEDVFARASLQTPVDVPVAAHVTNAAGGVSVGRANHGQVFVDNNGTPLDASDDVFCYTPYAGFAGRDHFHYKVSDGNGGVAKAKVTVDVSRVGLVADSVRPSRHDLFVLGTPKKDVITIRQMKGGLIAVVVNGKKEGVFSTRGRIYVEGQGGDDVVDATKVNRGIVFYGGAGDDKLIGGIKPSHLYGGAGNDVLVSNSGKDFLVGDEGNDVIK